LGKNVQDKIGAIQHFTTQDFGDVLLLRGRKLVIKNDGRNMMLFDIQVDFFHFSGAQKVLGWDAPFFGKIF
jgi:hypothetical protein